jgi:hypothetical protein
MKQEVKDIKKGWRRVTKVEILCTHIYKSENETYGNYSRNGRGGDKGE